MMKKTLQWKAISEWKSEKYTFFTFSKQFFLEICTIPRDVLM